MPYRYQYFIYYNDATGIYHHSKIFNFLQPDIFCICFGYLLLLQCDHHTPSRFYLELSVYILYVCNPSLYSLVAMKSADPFPCIYIFAFTSLYMPFTAFISIFGVLDFTSQFLSFKGVKCNPKIYKNTKQFLF